MPVLILLVLEPHMSGILLTTAIVGTILLLGGSGGVEAVITASMLRDQFAPPTAGYQVPDENCDLDICPNEGKRWRRSTRCPILWASADTTPPCCSGECNHRIKG